MVNTDKITLQTYMQGNDIVVLHFFFDNNNITMKNLKLIARENVNQYFVLHTPSQLMSKPENKCTKEDNS